MCVRFDPLFRNSMSDRARERSGLRFCMKEVNMQGYSGHLKRLHPEEDHEDISGGRANCLAS